MNEGTTVDGVADVDQGANANGEAATTELEVAHKNVLDTANALVDHAEKALGVWFMKYGVDGAAVDEGSKAELARIFKWELSFHQKFLPLYTRCWLQMSGVLGLNL